MAAGSGREFLLQFGDGASPEVFASIGACRSNTYARAGEAVPITDKASAGERELLSGGGDKSATISGAGVFKDTAGEQALESNYDDQLLHNYRVLFPTSAGGATHSFAAQVTAFEVTGEHNGAVEFSFTLEISGAITIS